jgi:GTPase SAR1 family protein
MNVVLVGDVNTGKTSFCRGGDSYVPTVGVDFALMGQTRVWDTSGQERFRSVGRGYYHLARVILIFYACGQEETQKSVKGWRAEASLHSDARIIVVGCKCDQGKEGEADIFISNTTGEGVEELKGMLPRRGLEMELRPAQRHCCYR